MKPAAPMDVERATATAVFWTPHSCFDPMRPEPVAVGAPRPNPFQWPPRRRPGTADVRSASRGAVQERRLRHRPGVGEKAIAGLPRITAGEAREKGCSVCMEAFEEGEALRRMHCSHAFHEDCISMWLSVSHLCPLCRFALRTQGQEDEEERTGRE
ncbi:hypothetical protein CFC21_069968 [Triticum aestivum]|uniref:RING-type domain-containing protein n=2 Tax=Triticum aestivum TaxID=4565 RepID=A0A3B6LGB7_WHEAT|nr:hypothetical protein CFC21_069968 [Triticum aestivum]